MKNFIKKIACTVLALATVLICGVSAFADTVKITTPNEARNGVVWIVCEGYDFIYDDDGNFVRNEEGEILIEPGAWTGTGFAIGDPTKPVEYIVTNAHVVLDGIEEKGDLQVYFSAAQNDFVVPTIYKIDEEKDIAILKLPEPTTKRTALVLCPSDAVNMDDDVAALGYPGASNVLIDNAKYDINDITLTKGVISRKTYQNDRMRSVYQIDAYINHGNSGGPLVNPKGEVIGINTFGWDGVNYAICIDELINLVSREQVGYVLSTDKKPFNPVPIIIIAAVAVVAAAVVVIILMMKKKAPATAQAAPAQRAVQSAPAPAPMQVTPPQSSSNAMLVCEKGVLAGRTFPLGNGVVIGRDPKRCGVCFPVDTKGVSGAHCEIRKTANGFEILDLGSSYGTTLGSGQKLTPNVAVFIPGGTYFMVGGAEQLFQIKY